MTILKIKDYELLMDKLHKAVVCFGGGDINVRVWASKNIIDLLCQENQRLHGMQIRYREGETTLFGAKVLPSPTENIMVGNIHGGFQEFSVDEFFYKQKPILT